MDTSVRHFKGSEALSISRRVKRTSWSCFLILTLMLAIGSFHTVNAEPGDRLRLGNAGEWKDTIGLAATYDGLYTIERNGGLYVTDLTSGKWIQLGKPEFANTIFMFSVSGSLYTIETNGNLYRVSPKDASWRAVGEPGVWKGTIAGTTLNDRIYTVEGNGALYETNPATGRWRQLGKPEFGRTRHIFAAEGTLYTIEDGGLYRVSPADGSWRLVGKAEDWTGTRAVAVFAGRLFSANRSGALYRSLLTTGSWTVVGKPVFGDTVYLFESGQQLYSIDADGSLYAIETPRLSR